MKVEVTGSNLPKLFLSTLVNQIVPSSGAGDAERRRCRCCEPEQAMGGVAHGFTWYSS